MIRTKRKIVDFMNNFDDWVCVELTRMGFSRAFVSEETGLTPTQCDYRCALMDVRRSEYRNGSNEIAECAISALTQLDIARIPKRELQRCNTRKRRSVPIKIN